MKIGYYIILYILYYLGNVIEKLARSGISRFRLYILYIISSRNTKLQRLTTKALNESKIMEIIKFSDYLFCYSIFLITC